MSYIADPFVVVLDTNAMVPVRARDVLFTFGMHGLFRARVTDDIMDEWERTLVNRIGVAADNVRSQRRLIQTHFGDSFVHGYRPLINALELPDPDDRHVLAAAIKCSAQHIVTNNHKDFPPEVLDEYDITTISADEFLSNTFSLYETSSLSALNSIRKKFGNPPMNASEFILDLTANGLPKLAAKARMSIEFL